MLLGDAWEPEIISPADASLYEPKPGETPVSRQCFTACQACRDCVIPHITDGMPKRLMLDLQRFQFVWKYMAHA
jgi:hypothetical protein